jgi:hypothetical protein
MFDVVIKINKDYIQEQHYEGGPKNNRNLNVARELEVIA